MSSASKTQRWLDLVAFLVGHQMPVTVKKIMEKVPPYAVDWVEGDKKTRDSVRRKFERDKAELRKLGIPLERVDFSISYGLERTQGYVLRSRDFYLPYLRLVSGAAEDAGEGVSSGRSERVEESGASDSFALREGEARAALDALGRVADLPAFPYRAEARSALRKLTFDLDPDFVAGESRPPVRYLEPPGTGELRNRLRRLSDALVRRKELAFRYYGIHRDTESSRRVRPYGLLFQHSHWYRIGHDLDREGMRLFRVGRMTEVEVNSSRPRSADYEVPEDFALSRWAGRPSWPLPGQDDEPISVDVRFEFPRSLWADRNGHGELVDKLTEGAQRRRFRVQDTGPFLRWLLGIRDGARIETPRRLEEARQALLRRVAGLHGEADA